MANHPKELNDFVKLLLEHQTALRAYIVSLMPGSDDAEDVLQNANVLIWEKMNTFEANTNFQAWIFAIARNLVKSQFRNNKRQMALLMDDDLIYAIDEVWHQKDIKSLSNKQRALDRCMERLNEHELALIEVRYTKGSNLEHYATQIDRPADSLRTAISRLRGKLRDCIQKRLILEGAAR